MTRALLLQDELRSLFTLLVALPELLVSVLEVELALDVGEEEVGEQEYLRRPKDEVDGEEVVGVGAAAVYPEVVQDRAEDSARHEHDENDESLWDGKLEE